MVVCADREGTVGSGQEGGRIKCWVLGVESTNIFKLCNLHGLYLTFFVPINYFII